ncbi:MAG: tyrosine-type recombinase/integrase, partial [Lachnospiraceae bacterium]|nr:tyrosine-type recombinase/integrase [Lachnospiraceae bacterium]
MTKGDLINEVAAALLDDMSKELVDRVKVTMIVKMTGYELVEVNTLPSTVVYDNEYIYKRFMIDMLAKGTKPSSIKTYFNMLKPFFNSTGLNYLEVTAQDLIDYLAMMQYSNNKITGKQRSKNYISTISRTFFVFFQWAYRKHHIETDIMRDVDRIKGQQKKKEKLSDEEIEDCRNSCRDARELALFETMLCTGMRVGELAKLKIKDINWITGQVNIYGEKTDKYRDGYLSIKAKNALRAYIGDRVNDYVFVGSRSTDKGRELGKGSIESIAKNIGERAAVHCKTNVHCYRKTFASNIYRRTGDVKVVSILLGHASTAVT